MPHLPSLIPPGANAPTSTNSTPLRETAGFGGSEWKEVFKAEGSAGRRPKERRWGSRAQSQWPLTPSDD